MKTATPPPRETLSCPLCGFAFEKGDTLCRHGCPLGPLCSLVRCPSCDYEFPERPQSVSWVARLLGRFRPAPPAAPQRVRDLRQLAAGARARVLGLGGADATRHNRLAVFGLVPGSELELLQCRPAYVVRIGETELALDAEIAGEVLVEELEAVPS